VVGDRGGAADSLAGEDGEDEVLVGVGEEVALVGIGAVEGVALVVTGVVEVVVSGEVAVVVEVSAEVVSGVHDNIYNDFHVYMSRFECLDLACDSSKSVCPLAHR